MGKKGPILCTEEFQLINVETSHSRKWNLIPLPLSVGCLSNDLLPTTGVWEGESGHMAVMKPSTHPLSQVVKGKIATDMVLVA